MADKKPILRPSRSDSIRIQGLRFALETTRTILRLLQTCSWHVVFAEWQWHISGNSQRPGRCKHGNRELGPHITWCQEACVETHPTAQIKLCGPQLPGSQRNCYLREAPENLESKIMGLRQEMSTRLWHIDVANEKYVNPDPTYEQFVKLDEEILQLSEQLSLQQQVHRNP